MNHLRRIFTVVATLGGAVLALAATPAAFAMQVPPPGEGSGIAFVKGDTATFKPDGVEGECKITLKFSHRKLIVTQTGACGFGNNVTAEGTYKRVSTKKPKFDSTEL